ALRLSWTMTDHYEPYPGQSRDLMLAAFKALNEKDCKTAVEKAKASVKLNYAEFRAHAVLADCYERAGDKAGHDREQAIGRGLVAALLATGDGKSVATAYDVVFISEEGFVMALHDAAEEQQALINDKGHMVDQISGKSQKTGETVTLYFKVDHL